MTTPTEVQEIARLGPVLPCQPGGKVPLTPHGSKDASRDAERIRAWLDRWPDANWALATGHGLVVLDVDAKSGGLESLEALFATHGDVNTVAVQTGGGGMHLYFLHEGVLPNSAGKVARGIDVRGDGGFVIAPGSVHASGARYVWEPGFSPSDVEIVPLPAWLLEAARGATSATPTAKPASEWVELISSIGDGRRNQTLAQVAGRLFRTRLPVELVVELVHAVNEARCQPPLEAGEVTKIVDSIAAREAARLAAEDKEWRSALGAVRGAKHV